MNLILVTALLAVCAADKLDRTYLPPASASTAGGTAASLQTPFKTFNQGLGGLPKGSYSNDFEGVVVDAVAPGTRASGADETGLGAPRVAYGSTNSKVGEAAFTADAAFPRVGINSGLNTQGALVAPNNFAQITESKPERIQSSRDRVSNTVKYENDVGPDKFNYAFETDNGIVAEENGVEVNGVKAQGGYSYTGDDGQVYSVTYTADEEGYRPKGDHLPTPPPIPEEILKSLEKNAQDEAAGVVDDGSYDAKKYSTGEDYTNTDNGQYNEGKPSRLANTPQSDAVASGSFISQNNQGLVRPIAFESTSTLGTSSSVPEKGNNFGIAGGVSKPAQNEQEFAFGGAKNEYLPPLNVFNQNRRPALNRLSTVQSNIQNGFALSSPNFNGGINNNQDKELPTFIPLSQQKLQEDKPKRPQPNSSIFGKPTIIDSTLAIKDPFVKRPFGNRYSQNKYTHLKPQTTGGSFEVVSGNVYSSKNEYLPPHRQGNKPNESNKNQHFQSVNSGTTQKHFTTSENISPSPTTSAFSPVSRPLSTFQTSQQNYGPTNSQYTGNINNTPSQISGFSNTPNIVNSPDSHLPSRQSIFASQNPTKVPQTELTTPIDSNSNLNEGIVPIPIVDGPDSPNLSSSPSKLSLDSQPSNSFSGQYNLNSNKNQQIIPTQASASASITSNLGDQTFKPVSENIREPGTFVDRFNSQSLLSNGLSVNGQYTFSTPIPSLNQNNQQKGSDVSYYYKTPSKPFIAPTPRPQDSEFPSSPFDQSFKVTQKPFGKPPLTEVSETLITPQSIGYIDNTRFPNPSTALGSIVPTLPTTQDERNKNVNTFQSQFNKVTQASTSPFPSARPTATADFNGNQFGQFNTRPLQSNNQLNKQTLGFKQQHSPSQPQQQYNGELYEYKKPSQIFPASQNGDSFGQTGLTTQFSSSISNPLVSQSQLVGTYKPIPQIGSKFTQQSPGYRPQNSQVSHENHAFNANNAAQTQTKPGQFNSLTPNQGQNFQSIQGASKFPPTYNKQGTSCCGQVNPQSSQGGQQDGTIQFTNQFRPNQVFGQEGSNQEIKTQETNPQSASTLAGVGESFGGPRKPPSFDETGYHY